MVGEIEVMGVNRVGIWVGDKVELWVEGWLIKGGGMGDG